MKIFAQLLAMLTLLMCVVADFPHYADDGQCETIQQWDKYSVIANCPKPDKTWQCSILDLDKCYINNKGAITPQEDGNFSGSCNDCYWTNTVLHCNCDIDPGHRFMQPQIETNLLLVNADGFMKCFDRVAEECPHGTSPTASIPPDVDSATFAAAPAAATQVARLREEKSFQA